MKAGRGDESRTVAAWEQPSMFPAEASEVTCRVGRVEDTGLYVFQVEAREQPGGRLVAMQSWPGVGEHQVPIVAEAVVAEMVRLAQVLTCPF